MGRLWLLLSVLVIAACGRGAPLKATAPPAVVTSAEPRAPIASAPAVVVQSEGEERVTAPRSFPQSQAALDALSYAERLSMARSALSDLVAGRASRTEAYAPALSLVRSIPSEASEALEARDVARSLAAFRPSVDEIIASTPPEQRLATATYLVSQVFKDRTRTELLDVAQKFIEAIPVDLVVDQEQLVTVKNAMLVLRVDGGSTAAAEGRTPRDLSGGDETSLAPNPSGTPYFPPVAPASCAGCPIHSKPIHVREHTRRDGTTVREHTRRAPRR